MDRRALPASSDFSASFCSGCQVQLFFPLIPGLVLSHHRKLVPEPDMGCGKKDEAARFCLPVRVSDVARDLLLLP